MTEDVGRFEKHIVRLESLYKHGIEQLKEEGKMEVEKLRMLHKQRIIELNKQLERVKEEIADVKVKAGMGLSRLQSDYAKSSRMASIRMQARQDSTHRQEMQVEEEKKKQAEMWDEKLKEQLAFQHSQMAKMNDEHREREIAKKADISRLERELQEVRTQTTQMVKRNDNITTEKLIRLHMQSEEAEEIAKEEKTQAILNRNAAEEEMEEKMKEMKQAYSELTTTNRQLQYTLRQLDELNSELLSLRKERFERDETIQDKVTRIAELEQKNKELDKFKFVLDWKIQELQEKTHPRQQESQVRIFLFFFPSSLHSCFILS